MRLSELEREARNYLIAKALLEEDASVSRICRECRITPRTYYRLIEENTVLRCAHAFKEIIKALPPDSVFPPQKKGLKQLYISKPSKIP